MKFKFCKIDKRKSDKLDPSLKTHEKKSANTFKTFKKKLDIFII